MLIYMPHFIVQSLTLCRPIYNVLHYLTCSGSDNHHFTSFYICAVKMEKVLSKNILRYQVCQIYSYFVYIPYLLTHTFMQQA